MDRQRLLAGLLVLSSTVGVFAITSTAVYATNGTTPSSTAAPATTARAVPPACSLLSPADLQSVLGGTANSGDLTAAPKVGETICLWTVTTSADGSGYSALLDVKTPSTSQEFTQQRRAASSPTKTVKKLGDAAFSERAKVGRQILDDLWVHAGNVAFRLEVLKGLGSAPLARLAPIVLTELSNAAGDY